MNVKNKKYLERDLKSFSCKSKQKSLMFQLDRDSSDSPCTLKCVSAPPHLGCSQDDFVSLFFFFYVKVAATNLFLTFISSKKKKKRNQVKPLLESNLSTARTAVCPPQRLLTTMVAAERLSHECTATEPKQQDTHSPVWSKTQPCERREKNGWQAR